MKTPTAKSVCISQGSFGILTRTIFAQPFWHTCTCNSWVFHLFFPSCVSYVPEPENSALLRCALNIFRKFNRYPEALRLALMLNDVELVENIFTSCKDM